MLKPKRKATEVEDPDTFPMRCRRENPGLSFSIVEEILGRFSPCSLFHDKKLSASNLLRSRVGILIKQRQTVCLRNKSDDIRRR